MATKTEYREYIAGEEWHKRRKEFLRNDPPCNRCGLPRWLVIVAYDQDIHVHPEARKAEEQNGRVEAIR